MPCIVFLFFFKRIVIYQEFGASLTESFQYGPQNVFELRIGNAWHVTETGKFRLPFLFNWLGWPMGNLNIQVMRCNVSMWTDLEGSTVPPWWSSVYSSPLLVLVCVYLFSWVFTRFPFEKKSFSCWHKTWELVLKILASAAPVVFVYTVCMMYNFRLVWYFPQDASQQLFLWSRFWSPFIFVIST